MINNDTEVISYHITKNWRVAKHRYKTTVLDDSYHIAKNWRVAKQYAVDTVRTWALSHSKKLEGSKTPDH